MSANYILLRSSGYYLRYNTPKRFKEVLCKRELRYTLKTHLLSEAKRRARKLVCRIETLLEDLLKKRMNLTDDQIQALIQQHVNSERQWIEEVYLTSKFQHKDIAAEHAKTIGHIVGDMQDDLAANNFRNVEAKVIKLLKAHGHEEINTEALPFLKLCREYSRASIGLGKYNESLLRGGDLLEATAYLNPSVTPSAIRIDLRHVQELVGHEKGKTMGATAIYDKGAPMSQLFEEIKKIQFDAVDIERLKDGWKGLALR